MIRHAFRSSPPPEARAVPYEELRDVLDDFDLLLWHGGNLAGRVIRAGQRIGQGMPGSWCHHVSTVLVAREPVRQVLNFESTTQSKTPDFFTGAERSGSQVNALSTRLRNYDGRLFVRFAPLSLRTSRSVRRLHEIRLETSGVLYERDWTSWIGAAIGFVRNREDRSSLFCSELIAYVLQEVGALDRREPSSEFAPADLTSERGLPEWGEEIEVLRPGANRARRSA